jgi:plasmid stabilization system protein ParE
MSRKYILSPRAVIDLESIKDFYRKTRGEGAAEKIARDLEEKADLIEAFSMIGARRNDLILGLRAFPCKPYIYFLSR